MYYFTTVFLHLTSFFDVIIKTKWRLNWAREAGSHPSHPELTCSEYTHHLRKDASNTLCYHHTRPRLLGRTQVYLAPTSQKRVDQEKLGLQTIFHLAVLVFSFSWKIQRSVNIVPALPMTVTWDGAYSLQIVTVLSTLLSRNGALAWFRALPWSL